MGSIIRCASRFLWAAIFRRSPAGAPGGCGGSVSRRANRFLSNEKWRAHPAISSPGRQLVPRHGWRRMLAGVCLLAAYSAALIWLTCVVVARAGTPHQRAGTGSRPLWTAMLQGPGNTYIVPPDAGLNLVEDLVPPGMCHSPITSEADTSISRCPASTPTVKRTCARSSSPALGTWSCCCTGAAFRVQSRARIPPLSARSSFR